MKSSSKMVAAAATLGVLGFAVLPLASYAAQTTVEVLINEECVITQDIGAPGGHSQALMQLTLSQSNDWGETSTAASGSNSIGVVCNDTNGWELTEKAATSALLPVSVGLPAGFTTWTAGNPSAEDFTAGTWSMKYAGTGVTATNYHSVPTTAGVIATSTTNATSTVTKTFGARANSALLAAPADIYRTIITYELTALAP